MKIPRTPELFAERPVRSEFTRRGPSYAMRRRITVAVLLAVIGGGLYWKFGAIGPANPGAIPFIKAEGAYKQRPERPGGIDIPHQDVQVYRELDGNGAAKPVTEHLLPPPETPQAPASAAPVQTTAHAVSTVESLAAPPAKPDLAPTSPPAPAVATTVTPTTPAPAQPMQAVPAATAKPAPKTIEDVIKTVTAPGKAGPVIQLASIPDRAAAQATLERLQVKYAGILKPDRLRLVKADLGEKRIYYRIQSSPLSAARAQDLCAALKQLKAGCIVVRSR